MPVPETRVQSLVQKEPLEEEVATYSSHPCLENHGQRSLAGYSPGVCKESDTTASFRKPGTDSSAGSTAALQLNFMKGEGHGDPGQGRKTRPLTWGPF